MNHNNRPKKSLFQALDGNNTNKKPKDITINKSKKSTSNNKRERKQQLPMTTPTNAIANTKPIENIDNIVENFSKYKKPSDYLFNFNQRLNKKEFEQTDIVLYEILLKNLFYSIFKNNYQINTDVDFLSELNTLCKFINTQQQDNIFSRLKTIISQLSSLNLFKVTPIDPNIFAECISELLASQISHKFVQPGCTLQSLQNGITKLEEMQKAVAPKLPRNTSNLPQRINDLTPLDILNIFNSRSFLISMVEDSSKLYNSCKVVDVADTGSQAKTWTRLTKIYDAIENEKHRLTKKSRNKTKRKENEKNAQINGSTTSQESKK